MESESTNKSIAIIGMGCLFPQANNLQEFWKLIYSGQDAITQVPPTHWNSKDFFDSDPKQPDHIYCDRGGYIPTTSFNPIDFGIPPTNLEATDTSQLLGLLVAKKALEDAGYGSEQQFDHEKVSVILGVTGTQELVIPLGARLGHPKWKKALLDSGIPDSKANEVVQRIADSYVPWQENSFPGLLGNVVAGRIANRFDFGGTNCVVDAACASSISAINLALLELHSHKSDMVITGGVDTLNDIFMHMCFCKTPALSPSGDARPFSDKADGTVLGEGIGLLILKRLSDAERDKDRIYAIIKGIGTSSDGRSQSIYAPRSDGQVKSILRAYDDAGVDPNSIELIEGHGTGTKVGDSTEIESLKKVFKTNEQKEKWCHLGSVKSQIGHTKAAAGVAGIIKSALSLHNKVLPPTIKIDQPHPKLLEKDSAFSLNTEPKPWLPNNNHPRRAGVSSFGFGGSNYHILLEEYQSSKTDVTWDQSIEILAISASTPQQVYQKLSALINKCEKDRDKDNNSTFLTQALACRKAFLSSDSCRLAIVVETDSEYLDLLKQAQQLLQNNENQQNGFESPGIYYKTGNHNGKIAFLFPGQGSQYPNMGRDIVCSFPEAYDTLQLAHDVWNQKEISKKLYPNSVFSKAEKDIQQKEITQTNIAQPAIGLVSLSLLKVLSRFNIKPDVVAGHSYGELVALHAAGCINEHELHLLSQERGRVMNDIKGDCGTMLAVRAPLDQIKQLIDSTDSISDNDTSNTDISNDDISTDDICLANLNSPLQGVLSGTKTAINHFHKVCKEKGLKAKMLPVAAAFHSPIMKNAEKQFKNFLNNISFSVSSIPVFAGSTAELYPSDPNEIREIIGNQLTGPVNFVGMLERLNKFGVTTYLEVGPKTALTGLIKATLKNQGINVIPCDSASGRQSDILCLARAIAKISVLGYPVDLSKWEKPFLETPKSLLNIPLVGANYRKEKTPNTEIKSSLNEEALVMSKNTDHKYPSHDSKSANHDFKPINHDSKPINHESKLEMPNTKSTCLTDAFKVVQEGIKSMQSLQQQTAEAHKRFLEGQENANKTMQEMMMQTHRLANNFMGNSVNDIYKSTSQSLTTPSPVEQYTASPIEQYSPSSNEQQPTVSTVSQHPYSSPIIQPNEELGINTHKDTNDFFMSQNNINTTNMSSPTISDVLNSSVSNAEQQQSPSKKAPDSIKNSDNLDNLDNIIINVVSELTGYPNEMLGMEMDIEADLGIDSIKRVEILSKLDQKVPNLPQIAPDDISKLRTLGEISHYLSDLESQSDKISNQSNSTSPPNLTTNSASSLTTNLSSSLNTDSEKKNSDVVY